ncbi:MAG TPA: glycine/betaine ABC transporter ATP-binding protein [Peptococcaceae bacterium]|nr:glycine/betaine ABC transporter ATP-binding protein [Peptococcaceae bacterium]
MKKKVVVENLSKIFGDRPEKALDLVKKGHSKEEILEKTGQAVGVYDVSFEVEEGEVFVLMGLSGSGKSTLLRCINRLIEPTVGKIYIDDEDITSFSEEKLRELRRKKLGMVFQRFALFPHRTVIQNVAFGLEIQGVEERERLAKARQLLEMVGLKEWENAYPDQLSGGMQQRVGLARALASDPGILLMDEAFSGLDPLIKREMQNELLSLQSKVNKTIIFVTHDLDEALRIGDRIALMKDGRIVQIGTPEEILTNPANEYVRKFVEDVDMTKVLVAEGIMKRPEMVAVKEGPRVALRMMREAGISSIFAVTRDRRLAGIVTAEDAYEARERGEKDLTNILITDIPTARPNTPVSDLIPILAESKFPVAVIDENKKLLGVIVRGALLAGMVRKRDETE